MTKTRKNTGKKLSSLEKTTIRRRRHKSRSDETSHCKENCIILKFIEMLNTTKIYHWRTLSFAQHKATDTLYEELNKNIDSFVEIMLGQTGKRVDLSSVKSIPFHDCKNVAAFTKEIEKYKQFLKNLDNTAIGSRSDLLNIRDTILGDLNQLTYLLVFP